MSQTVTTGRWRRLALMLAVTVMFTIASGIGVPGIARADSAGDWLTRAFAKPSNLGNPGRAEGAPRRKGPKGVQVASIGGSWDLPTAPKPSLSGGVHWVASGSCLNSSLRGAVHHIGSNYGRVVVSSTCRSPGHNARVGGAPKSHHLTGDAVDFRVHGNYGAAHSYLKSQGFGGVKHYGGGLFHVDTGPKRSW